jgi:tetratricopeptide (TPR) repeat protein
LREAALADFDQAGQLWRWHATVAEYARGHWPFTPDEQRAQKLALLPAWERWLKRLPAGEQAHARLEASRINLEAAAEDCAGYSRQDAGAFLDVLEGRMPLAERTLDLREMKEIVLRVELVLLPAEEKAERARLLGNLGVALSALGRREEALEAAREAADIRRTLAEKNPQAFLPNLARSLGVYGNVLLGMERYGEAARAFSEGLLLLAPFFQELPQAFGDLAGALKRRYLEACRKAGEEPDGELLSQFNSEENQV